MGVFQFVDSIASSPTVRLDLNTGSIMVADPVDLTPPPLRRSVVSTLLQDGEQIPASAYGNRVLRIPLQLVTTSQDLAATQLQNLARELDRPTNILKVQLGTAPVFFRTFSAPDYAIEMPKLLSQYGRATLEIPAEPFAYGLREDVNSGSTITVNNDPAAGSNPLYFDVSSVKGDVETPLFMKVDQTTVSASGHRVGVFGVRRRGTPSGPPVPFVFQAEASTSLGSDTTVQTTDSAMSGATNNYIRTTFATVTTPTFRFTTSPATGWPTTPSVDLRGTYRVFVRCRHSVAGDTIQLRSEVYANGTVVYGDWATLPNNTGLRMIDLGLMSLPFGPDPVTDGFSNTEIPVKGMSFGVSAQRVAGTGNVDFDYAVWVPADDRLAIVKWPQYSGPDYFTVDPNRSMIYPTLSGNMVPEDLAEIVGGLPYVSPGVTNRIVYLRDVGAGSGGDDKTGTLAFTAYYWPRYLHVRPVGT